MPKLLKEIPIHTIMYIYIIRIHRKDHLFKFIYTWNIGKLSILVLTNHPWDTFQSIFIDKIFFTSKDIFNAFTSYLIYCGLLVVNYQSLSSESDIVVVSYFINFSHLDTHNDAYVLPLCLFPCLNKPANIFEHCEKCFFFVFFNQNISFLPSSSLFFKYTMTFFVTLMFIVKK